MEPSPLGGWFKVASPSPLGVWFWGPWYCRRGVGRKTHTVTQYFTTPQRAAVASWAREQKGSSLAHSWGSPVGHWLTVRRWVGLDWLLAAGPVRVSVWSPGWAFRCSVDSVALAPHGEVFWLENCSHPPSRLCSGLIRVWKIHSRRVLHQV